MKPAKFGEGFIAQELNPEEAVDSGEGILIGMIKMWKTGAVGLLWTPVIFTNALPLPDDLRAKLVEILRYHADRLEDRSMDARMKELAGKMMGGEA